MIFDLQLFNEEQPPMEDSTLDKNVDFAIDNDGNVIFRDDEITQEESPTQEEQPPDNTYTPEELRQQQDFSKIDPNRLPKELQELYKSMQSPFTRNMQQIAEMKQQLQAQLEQQMQQQKPPVQQEQSNVQPNTQRQYYEQVFNVAKKNVEKNLEESFDELNPLHIAALSEEVANIKAYVVQSQNTQQTIDNILRPYTSDPEWKNIQAYTNSVLNSLPYEQSVAIRQRLDSGDVYFLNDFLKTSKQEYYKSKNPPPAPQPQNKVKPPVVESGGTGISPNNSPMNFNHKNLGKMSTDQLANTFIDLGLVEL